MKTKAVLYTTRKKANGTIPIYIRVTHKDNTGYEPTGKFVMKKDWDDDLGKVKRTHESYKSINEKIDTRLAQINKAAEVLIEESNVKNPKVTARQLFDFSGFSKRELNDIFICCHMYITKKFTEPHQIETYRKYRTQMNHLDDFLKSRGRNDTTMSFNELTVDFIEEYRAWLFKPAMVEDRRTGKVVERKAMKINTVFNVFKNLKCLYNYAIRKHAANADLYPFNDEELVIEQELTEGCRLTQEEIQKLFNVKLVPGSLAFNCRAAWFLLYYCKGSRISDGLSLRWIEISEDCTQILGHTIRKTMHIKSKKLKPKPTIKITVPDGAVPILRYYKKLNESKAIPSRYVLPMIHDVDKDKLPQAIKTATALVNKFLKVACRKAGIPEVSTHSARRSFGDAAEAAHDARTAQKLMDHAKMEMTERYLSPVSIKRESDANAKVSEFLGLPEWVPND